MVKSRAILLIDFKYKAPHLKLTSDLENKYFAKEIYFIGRDQKYIPLVLILWSCLKICSLKTLSLPGWDHEFIQSLPLKF